MSIVKRPLRRIRSQLMLDYHLYANPDFDGERVTNSSVLKRRLALFIKSSQLQVKYREALDTVRTVCLFVGYPRSGHSLVGSLLDAHPHASIAHEFNVVGLMGRGRFRERQLEALMLDHSAQMAQTGRIWGYGYDYTLRDSYQGVFRTPLQVVGDKKGGATARLLVERPSSFDRVYETFGDKLRFIIHLRNPFDIVATMSKRSGSYDVSPGIVDVFNNLTRGVEMVINRMHRSHVFVGHHEDLLDNPATYLNDLLGFLELDTEPEFIEACDGLVDKRRRATRFDVVWSSDTKDAISATISRSEFLSRYSFSDPDT